MIDILNEFEVSNLKMKLRLVPIQGLEEDKHNTRHRTIATSNGNSSFHNLNFPSMIEIETYRFPTPKSPYVNIVHSNGYSALALPAICSYLQQVTCHTSSPILNYCTSREKCSHLDELLLSKLVILT